MQGNSSNGSCALWARGFAALWVALVLVIAFSARPAEAAPFAYVANEGSGTVSVIDTATNTVVATVPVGSWPAGVAVNPDGKHAYVTNFNDGPSTVSVIDTATNTVAMGTGFPIPVGIEPVGVAVTPDGKHVYVANMNEGFFRSRHCFRDWHGHNPPSVTATVAVGSSPNGVAVTPDGKHAYVANTRSDTVSVIATATNTVVATVPVGILPSGVAVTPDGKHAYVTFPNSNKVSVIDTATNTVVGIPIPVWVTPRAIAITPDGKHAYVASRGTGTGTMDTVSVIDTASNMVVATVTVGASPDGVAVTPDGKHAYVANRGSNNVSVIDTASNTVEATVGVGRMPNGVGIGPAPPGGPWLAFIAFSAKLAIFSGHTPNQGAFGLLSSFTLGSAGNGIDPVAEPVTLQVGTFTTL